MDSRTLTACSESGYTVLNSALSNAIGYHLINEPLKSSLQPASCTNLCFSAQSDTTDFNAHVMCLTDVVLV